MKDIFGNAKPVEIAPGEFWFNGRIIQQQTHPKLKLWPWISFDDVYENNNFQSHFTMREAIKYCLQNPCKEPDNQPNEYL